MAGHRSSGLQKLEMRCNIGRRSEEPHTTSLEQVNTITIKKKIPKSPLRDPPAHQRIAIFVFELAVWYGQLPRAQREVFMNRHNNKS